jgi:hypothetical protein
MSTAEISEEYVGAPGLSDKDARVFNKLLEKIRKDRGHLKSQDFLKEVIDRSRPADSPTHHLFEWDARKGHAIYLIERARQLVMKVEIIFSEMPKVRAWRGAVIEGVRGPAPIKQIISSKELMAAVLEEAKAALAMWSQKYKDLEKVSELRAVFKAIKPILS